MMMEKRMTALDSAFEMAEGHNFFGADLSFSEVDKMRFAKCEFVHAKFFGARFKACVFVDCKFSAADLANGRFKNCRFENCEFFGARLYSTVLDECVFAGCDFTGVFAEFVFADKETFFFQCKNAESVARAVFSEAKIEV